MATHVAIFPQSDAFSRYRPDAAELKKNSHHWLRSPLIEDEVLRATEEKPMNFVIEAINADAIHTAD